MFNLERSFFGSKKIDKKENKENGENSSEESIESSEIPAIDKNRLEEAAILQKIRNRSEFVTPALQGLALSTIVAGGLELGKKIDQDMTKHKEETRKEIILSAPEANKYAMEKTDSAISDTARILNDDKLMSEVALSMKGDVSNNAIKSAIYDLMREKQSTLSLMQDSSKIAEDDLERGKKMLTDLDSKIAERKKQLEKQEVQEGESGKKAARKKIIDLNILIERAKLELVAHLKSDKYLEKLAKEMNISKEAAKEHQRVRINNILNLSYDLKSGEEISADTDGIGYAYYRGGNKIVLPYDIDLTDKAQKDYFYDAILHEALHESSQYQKGMSSASIKTLKDAFKSMGDGETKKALAYFSEPGELIVRKQILDLEMEKLGLKEYGKKFTNDHYQKLLNLKKADKLSSEATQLIDHIKPEDFSKVMNELAEASVKGGTYQHAGWQYGDINNQA